MNSVLHKLRKEVIDSYGGQPIDAREIDAKLSLKANIKELKCFLLKILNQYN